MNATLKSIYKKYNHNTLEDAGCYVSEEYKGFQNDLKRSMKKLAIELNAEVISFTKGHYFESIVFHRNGHYVYLHHESLNRTHIDFDNNGWSKDWFARTMAHSTDWRGGENHNDFNWETLPEKIDKLLNTEHKRF